MLFERTIMKILIVDDSAVCESNGVKEAGRYSVQFNAGKNYSGIYFYTIKAGNFLDKKIIDNEVSKEELHINKTKEIII